jgi:hypothetical protein
LHGVLGNGRLERGDILHLERVLAFSETVLVTEDGGERLTRAERRLFER